MRIGSTCYSKFAHSCECECCSTVGGLPHRIIWNWLQLSYDQQWISGIETYWLFLLFICSSLLHIWWSPKSLGFIWRQHEPKAFRLPGKFTTISNQTRSKSAEGWQATSWCTAGFDKSSPAVSKLLNPLRLSPQL